MVLLESLGKDLNLDIVERRFLQLLVQLEKQRDRNADTRSTLQEMHELAPAGTQRLAVDLQQFEMIAEWYHIVIKQMAGAPGFREDGVWIAGRLGNKITPAQAVKALETLRTCGFLGASDRGIETPRDIPSAALRAHHLGMLERAQEALVEQDVSEREISSLTLRLERARIEEAKAWLRKMKVEFDQEFGCPESEDVFQLNIQFFGHTPDREGQVYGHA